ncbi:MAG: hypothetical protein ABJB12_19555 [Pseudomonadota bacterium]
MINTAKSLEARSRSRRFLSGSSASGLGAALAALLVPKCPLCVAALLTLVGMGAPLASAIAPLLRPLLFGLLVVTLLWLLIARVHARRSSDAGLARSEPPGRPRGCCR